MPIHDYKCDDCGHEEIDVFYNKPAKDVIHPTNCPKCGSDTYHIIPARFLGDVVDGSAYNGGYKDYRSRMTLSQQADVVSGKINPY